MSDIYTLFEGLERCAPGDAASLARVLAQVPRGGRILDAGCGTGGDLAQLAAHGHVTGIDLSQRFVDVARARGHDAVCADMLAPPPGPYDLIWCAGAIYSVGVARALAAWRGHLAQGGRVAFSDTCWTRADVAQDIRDWWAASGAEVDSAPALEARVAAQGWRCLDAFWLGPAGWAAYYDPVAARLDQGGLDPELVAGFRAEIALWRASAGAYDYRVILCEPDDPR
jgi:SAM-dependent methyltransferase